MFTKKISVFWLCALVLCVAMFLIGCGKKSAESAGGTKTDAVSFSSGTVERDAESITLALTEGETALLEELPGLKKADLRGSSCEEEIMAFAGTHPEMEIVYTVTMSDGTKVDTDAESVTAALSADDMPRLESLTSLQKADLRGSSCESELMDYANAHPEVELLYTVTLPDGSKADTDAEELDFSRYTSDMTESGIIALKALRGVKRVELGDEKGPVTIAEAIKYATARPDIVFHYVFAFKGITVSTDEEKIDMHGVWLKDQEEDLWAILPLLRHCTWLDLDGSGVETDEVVAMMEQNPGLRIIWRVGIGNGEGVRTDATKIWFNTLQDTEEAQNLKYCIDCELMDLGHCYLKDISFVASMPKLRVCILGLNPLTDITPLKGCKKLEYLEIFNMPLADLSPLADHPDLAHLNIVLTEVTDLSPLYSCPLQRLWIGDTTPVSAEELEAFRKVNPDCEVNTTTYSPSDGGWRRYGNQDFAPRYLQLRDEMGY